VPEIYRRLGCERKGAAAEAAWNEKFAAYEAEFPSWPPSSSVAWPANCRRTGRAKADAFIAECNEKAESPATRKASLNSLEAYAPMLPECSAVLPTWLLQPDRVVQVTSRCAR
jgi:transketolase